MDDKEKLQKYISSKLNYRTLLEQLAEEASELSQASLKVIRAYNLSDNYTPVSPLEAKANLREELEDVLVVSELLGLTKTDWYSEKLERWAKRLGYKDGEK